jgi:UDP-N-acetylmuramoyl-L-alanyl-D-glutamate--2,6-diaminopimelate ligase
MKTLQQLITGIKIRQTIGSTDLSINSVAFDSRSVEAGGLFVAVAGTRTDGHQYIEKAISQGAVAVICQQVPDHLRESATFILTDNSAEALGHVAAAFYDHPSQDLKIIGVTGTNGKTTTVFLLHQLYSKLGFACGLLSTIENRIGNQRNASTHTTADALQINANLRQMADAGCEYCFMEISSHAAEQHRTAGLHIHGLIFTNITHDHLDYHLTFDNYLKAKKKLFDQLPADAFALVNSDDRNGSVMLQNTRAQKATYSLKSPSDYKGKILENLFEGLFLRVGKHDIYTRLTGAFNAYNLMGTYGAAMLDSQPEEKVLVILSELQPAEGRFQVVPSASGIVAIVDYAHTPDALTNVLQTIHATRQGGEHLITVVGAGGNRDRTKRPVMAQVVSRMSDRVILTSDNPRDEDPMEIINEMEAGVAKADRRKTVKISDRREAIKTACMIAIKGDIILVAGKGHETYQEINGQRHHFDDREVLEEYLNNENEIIK